MRTMNRRETRRTASVLRLCASALAFFAPLLLAGETPAILKWEPLHEPGCGGWITSVAASPHDPKRILLGGDMLGVGLSEDQGQSWQGAFGFASWEIAEFTFHPADPRAVWVGTMSGPYLSTDGGRNWQARRAGFPPLGSHHYSAPAQKVLFDPNTAKRLVAVGGSHRRWSSPGKPLWGAVWESADGGETWKQLATVADGANIVSAAFAAGSSEMLYAAVDGKGVYVSTDGGKSWSARNSGLPHAAVNRLAVHPKNREMLWIALGNSNAKGKLEPGGVYKSTDGAASWQPAQEGLARKGGRDPNLTSRYQSLAVSPTNPDLLLTSDTAWDGGVLYLSRDGAKSWQGVASKKDVDCAYPSGLGMTVVEFDPHSPEVAYAAGSEYLIRTADGGKTWKDLTAARVPGTEAWRGTGYSGLCSTGFRFHPADPERAALLGMDHGNFWQGLDNWGGGTDVAFAGADVMYATFGQGSFVGIGKTSDGGKTWELLAGAKRGLPERNSGAHPLAIHVLPDDGQTVWAAVGGKLYHTADGGAQWRVVLDGPGVHWIAAVHGQPRHFFVSGQKGVYETEDGKEFKLLPGGPQPAHRLALDRGTPPRLYATSWRQKQGGLWRSAGGAWTRLRDDAFIHDVAVDPADPNRLAIATHDHPYHDACYATGVWISSDGGKTWSQQNTGLSCLRGECIAINPHDPEQLVFGTHGRGFFVARWPKK